MSKTKAKHARAANGDGTEQQRDLHPDAEILARLVKKVGSGRKAKDKANGKGRPGVGHNSKLGDRSREEVYRRWLSKIETADNVYEKAKDVAKSRKGELAAIYAAAKEDGCNIDAIKEARA